MNGTVIVPEGYPTVLKAVQDAGYETITVDTSEYPQAGRRPELPVAALQTWGLFVAAA